MYEFTADPLLDLLTIPRNFDRLSLIQWIQQMSRLGEGQFLPTNPVHLKDSAEQLLSC